MGVNVVWPWAAIIQPACARCGGFFTTLADHLTFQHAQSLGLQAQKLTVRRGSEVLFKALDFELQAGQLVWLRGANGSGKTSLLRVVAGLARPDGGELRWNNEPLAQSADFRSQLVYMGHTNALKDDLTALEALAFLTTLHGRSCSAAHMEAALRRLGVFHRRRLLVRMLSQGQRRRVDLARLALEDQPGIWVLDEPFDALDDAGVQLVQELFRDNLQRGGAVLFTSHIAVRPQGLELHELNLVKNA